MHYVTLDFNFDSLQFGNHIHSFKVGRKVSTDSTFDVDKVKEGWIQKWGEPGSVYGTSQKSWTLTYDSDKAIMKARARISNPHDIRVTLSFKKPRFGETSSGESGELIGTWGMDPDISIWLSISIACRNGNRKHS